MLGVTMWGFILGLGVGGAIWTVYLFFKERSLNEAREGAKDLIERTRREALEERRILIERGKEETRLRKSELELEQKKKRMEILKLEHSLQKRSEHINEMEQRLINRQKEVEHKGKNLEDREVELTVKEDRVHNSLQSLVRQLEQVSHMSRAQAKEVLLESLRNAVELENSQWLTKKLEEVQLKAKESAIDMLCSAMQRYVTDQVSICSSGVVQLPNEDMKGRIIGKEGRNIRSLEMATGMEFVIGDSSDTITISGFNPIRREIARKTLVTLLQDGRINPTRIEEVALRCEAEINEQIESMGRQVANEMRFSGMHKELTNMLGKLYFRTSYSQNVLEHSRETAYFSRLIAEELGLNGNLAARCGLLHDIGKAVSHEVEGSHALVGADLAKKYGENEVVVNAIAAHHEDVPPATPYAIIVMLADTISASRIGARKETLAAYIKKLEQLEEIAGRFEGVKKVYALQAGREIRIIVDEAQLDDAASALLARNIAKKVTDEMNFPGQIKVNVIREKRSIEYAK